MHSGSYHCDCIEGRINTVWSNFPIRLTPFSHTVFSFITPSCWWWCLLIYPFHLLTTTKSEPTTNTFSDITLHTQRICWTALSTQHFSSFHLSVAGGTTHHEPVAINACKMWWWTICSKLHAIYKEIAFPTDARIKTKWSEIIVVDSFRHKHTREHSIYAKPIYSQKKEQRKWDCKYAFSHVPRLITWAISANLVENCLFNTMRQHGAGDWVEQRIAAEEHNTAKQGRNERLE